MRGKAPVSDATLSSSSFSTSLLEIEPNWDSSFPSAHTSFCIRASRSCEHGLKRSRISGESHSWVTALPLISISTAFSSALMTTFDGLRSICVSPWEWSSWSPKAICNAHLCHDRPSFWPESRNASSSVPFGWYSTTRPRNTRASSSPPSLDVRYGLPDTTTAISCTIKFASRTNFKFLNSCSKISVSLGS